MTKIEWVRNADGTPGESWNPIVGCSIATPGCTNCYAQRTAWRLANNPATPHYAGTVELVKGKPIWTGKIARAPDRVLTEPLRRRKPTTYFVNSMGDLFHEDVPDEWIEETFGVMVAAVHLHDHTMQVLTKRSARMRDILNSDTFWEMVNAFAADHVMNRVDPHARLSDDARATLDDYGPDNPPPGIWLGVSAERQKEADERIPLLLVTPAAIRFVSAEPLLGPVDLTKVRAIAPPDLPFFTAGTPLCEDPSCYRGRPHYPREFGCRWGKEPNGLPGLDWVIVGGESGPGARPMHPDWSRAIRDQCQAAGVPFFFKQWGEWLPGQYQPGHGPLRWQDGTAGGETQKLHRWPDGVYSKRVGKTRTHRTLDARTWDEMPGGDR